MSLKTAGGGLGQVLGLALDVGTSVLVDEAARSTQRLLRRRGP